MGNDKAGKYQHYNGKYKNAKPMTIAFHGTPIVPVTWNGRAARTIRDSTTRASEDKANPVLTSSWYRILAPRKAPPLLPVPCPSYTGKTGDRDEIFPNVGHSKACETFAHEFAQTRS